MLLLDASAVPTRLTVEELKSRWLDRCIERSRPEDMSAFSLKRALALLVREDTVVELVNKTEDLVSKSGSEVFVTESELRRIWTEQSLRAMGRAASLFSVEESLLLVPDEDDDIIMGDDEDEEDEVSRVEDYEGRSRSIDVSSKLAKDADLVPVMKDDKEYFVTLEELKRVWGEQASSTTWGGPAAGDKAFNTEESLLLIADNDESDEDEHDGQEYVAAAEGSGDAMVDDGYWETVERLRGPAVRAELQRVFAELEDMSTYQPAWKKERVFLTPDIDTQTFMGDIMNSNTYMTTRIPANWDDPEEEGMSEPYLSSNTMAWPDQEETDYNVQMTIWERLNLTGPMTPQYYEKDEEVAAPAAPRIAATGDPSTTIDWSNYDFAALEGGAAAAELGGNATASDMLNVDDFFNDLSAGKNFMDDRRAAPEAEEVDEDDEEDELNPRNGASGDSYRDDSVLSNWRTPPEWLQKPEFADHVGFEVWSKYTFEKADDEWNSVDMATAAAMEHVSKVTDLYLVDHLAVSRQIDDIKYWERYMDAKLAGSEDPEDYKEQVPVWLTPDKHRGVEYSDEIIEMKGKMTLHPKVEEPAVAFKDDSFTHNEDMITTNKIGTIRSQYNWQPPADRTEEDYHIDEKIARKIQPVIRFVNHLARLRSTKDNVLIFEYKGVMRHLIGVRAMMMGIAKECFPEMVDLRLETKRASDKFDR